MTRGKWGKGGHRTVGQRKSRVGRVIVVMIPTLSGLVNTVGTRAYDGSFHSSKAFPKRSRCCVFGRGGPDPMTDDDVSVPCETHNLVLR